MPDLIPLIPGSFKPEDASIPDNFTRPQQQAAAEILVIFAERLNNGDDRAVPISCRYLARRLGWWASHDEVARMRTWRALRALVDCGWLMEWEPLEGDLLPGEVPPNGKRQPGCQTYLPGQPLLGDSELLWVEPAKDDAPDDETDPAEIVAFADVPF